MLVLITGTPGSGKSTMCEELRARGYQALDADDLDLCAWVDRATGETMNERPAFTARTPQFYEHYVWRYEPTQAELLAGEYVDAVCFVGGGRGGRGDDSASVREGVLFAYRLR